MIKIRFIINPKTKRHHIYNQTKVEAFFKQYEKRFQVDYHIVSKRGDVTRIIHQAKIDQVDTIVLVGGSGTKLEALQSLVNTNINVAFIPTGVSEGFTYYVDYPRELDPCLDLIINGRLEQVDVGCVKDDSDSMYFLSYFCAGVTADSVRITASKTKKTNTLLKCIYHSFISFLKFKNYHMKVQLPKETISKEFKEVFVGNVSTFGGRYDRYYQSSVKDGQLEIGLFYNLYLYKLLVFLTLHLLNIGFGFIKLANQMVSLKSCIIDIPDGVPTQIDWEEVSFQGSVRVSSSRKALRLIVPKSLMLV